MIINDTLAGSNFAWPINVNAQCFEAVLKKFLPFLEQWYFLWFRIITFYAYHRPPAILWPPRYDTCIFAAASVIMCEVMSIKPNLCFQYKYDFVQGLQNTRLKRIARNVQLRACLLLRQHKGIVTIPRETMWQIQYQKTGVRFPR